MVTVLNLSRSGTVASSSGSLVWSGLVKAAFWEGIGYPNQIQKYPYPSDIKLPIPKRIGYCPMDVGKPMGNWRRWFFSPWVSSCLLVLEIGSTSWCGQNELLSLAQCALRLQCRCPAWSCGGQADTAHKRESFGGRLWAERRGKLVCWSGIWVYLWVTTNYPPHTQILLGNFLSSILYPNRVGMGLDVGDGDPAADLGILNYGSSLES